ncbi:MAG: glycosyltransferase [bacterium]
MASTAARVSRYLTINATPAVTLVFKADRITRHFSNTVKSFPTDKILTSFNRQAEYREEWQQIIPLAVEPSFVISLYMGRPAYMGHLLARLLWVPHYIVCLGSDVNHHFERFVHKWRFPWLIKCAKRIGILSPDMRDKFRSFSDSDGKITLLSPGYDTASFFPMDVPIEYDILFVGRARPVKGLDRLVTALSKITRSARVCCVIPVNDADAAFAATYRETAARKASHHSFVWLPQQTPIELRQLYNASRFVVVPSRSEGAPHVVLEAMACNRPVIAADVGRIAEFLGSCKTLFTTDEDLERLLAAVVDETLDVPTNLRRQALAIANQNDECTAFRRFVDLEDE